ncbi:A24 family peptidase [Methylobacillus gramineus]|uniref:A24 family peptidase n=1 Tax=Methylobacillus gramineus TaxID=755169 RepID=UPI001CFFCA04|nr:A24 family peptidase [Methylobacillus gramineus]MCB5184482.1 A24 family peptidase [Methylobacillus gramineus]
MSILIISVWAGIISFYDFTQRRIPNALSLGALLFGLGYVVIAGQTYYGQPVSSALWGLAVAFLLTIPGYASHSLGGGDVKLLAAIAVLCGFKVVVASFVLASLGVLSVLMAWWYFSHQLIALGWMPLVPRERKRRYIPFGAALALGMCVAVLFPELWGMQSWQI